MGCYFICLDKGVNEMLSKDLEVILNLVFRDVWIKCYEYMIVEYLLLVLLDNDVVLMVLKVCGINLDEFCLDLVNFVDEMIFFILFGDSDCEI